MTEPAGEGPGVPGKVGGLPGELPPGPSGELPPGPSGELPPGPSGEVGGTPSEPPPTSGHVAAPPTGPTRPAPRRPVPFTVVGTVVTVAAAVYAWFASATTPFTLPANVTTAVPLLGMAVVVTLQWVRPAGNVWRRLPADRPPDGGTALPWLVLLALLVVPEGVSLLASGARSSHPTISYLTDTVFRWHAAKAAVYFLWLRLCWYFVRR